MSNNGNHGDGNKLFSSAHISSMLPCPISLLLCCHTQTSQVFINVSPRWKTTKRQGVGVRSLARNSLGVEGHATTSKWELGRMTSGSIIHMDLHKPNMQQVG